MGNEGAGALNLARSTESDRRLNDEGPEAKIRGGRGGIGLGAAKVRGGLEGIGAGAFNGVDVVIRSSFYKVAWRLDRRLHTTRFHLLTISPLLALELSCIIESLSSSICMSSSSASDAMVINSLQSNDTFARTFEVVRHIVCLKMVLWSTRGGTFIFHSPGIQVRVRP